MLVFSNFQYGVSMEIVLIFEYENQNELTSIYYYYYVYKKKNGQMYDGVINIINNHLTFSIYKKEEENKQEIRFFKYNN